MRLGGIHGLERWADSFMGSALLPEQKVVVPAHSASRTYAKGGTCTFHLMVRCASTHLHLADALIPLLNVTAIVGKNRWVSQACPEFPCSALMFQTNQSPKGQNSDWLISSSQYLLYTGMFAEKGGKYQCLSIFPLYFTICNSFVFWASPDFRLRLLLFYRWRNWDRKILCLLSPSCLCSTLILLKKREGTPSVSFGTASGFQQISWKILTKTCKTSVKVEFWGEGNHRVVTYPKWLARLMEMQSRKQFLIMI